VSKTIRDRTSRESRLSRAVREEADNSDKRDWAAAPLNEGSIKYFVRNNAYATFV
jgi:hypothetical protein